MRIDSDVHTVVPQRVSQTESPGMFVAIVIGIALTVALLGATLILGAT